MKAYREGRPVTPFILYLSSRWRWAVRLTPRPLYPRNKPIRRLVRSCWRRVKSVAPTGIQTPDLPALSLFARLYLILQWHGRHANLLDEREIIYGHEIVGGNRFSVNTSAKLIIRYILIDCKVTTCRPCENFPSAFVLMALTSHWNWTCEVSYRARS
jgi:hypothetical protein